MIVLAGSGNAFMYWVKNLLPPLTEENYGRGKDHWFDYLGRWDKDKCRGQFPASNILDVADPRISAFCRAKVLELEEIV